jgi:prevent-host-death family protein
MSMETSKSEFKAKALEYFRLVEETGDPIVVTDRGAPTIEVRPFRGEFRDVWALLRGSVLRYDAPLEPAGEVWDALS